MPTVCVASRWAYQWHHRAVLRQYTSWECDITQTQTAQLAAQAEHLNPAQTAAYDTLTTNAQRVAFIEACPVPVQQTGALWLNITLDGKKFLGIPSWMMATKLMGASRSADTMDASSAAIKDGTLELAALNGLLTVEFVHGPDDAPVVIAGVELDTGTAHDARATRDAEYRAANPRQGNGQAQVFTPVAQMP
jgi:hypothetical protein